MISPSRDDATSCFLGFGYAGIWGNAGHRLCRQLQQRDGFDVPGTEVTADLVHPHNKSCDAHLSLISHKHFRRMKVTFHPDHSTGKRARLWTWQWGLDLTLTPPPLLSKRRHDPRRGQGHVSVAVARSLLERTGGSGRPKVLVGIEQCCVLCPVASVVSNLSDLWPVAHQAPLCMRLSRQEYCSGLLCPPPGDLPNPGIEPTSLASPALQAGSLSHLGSLGNLPSLPGILQPGHSRPEPTSGSSIDGQALVSPEEVGSSLAHLYLGTFILNVALRVKMANVWANCRVRKYNQGDVLCSPQA